MAKLTRYFCCICNKELPKGEPIRIQKFLYGVKVYKQYESVATYDFCPSCFKLIEELLKKHNAITNQERREQLQEVEDEEDLW